MTSIPSPPNPNSPFEPVAKKLDEIVKILERLHKLISERMPNENQRAEDRKNDDGVSD